jgi:hypothetical protein
MSTRASVTPVANRRNRVGPCSGVQARVIFGSSCNEAARRSQPHNAPCCDQLTSGNPLLFSGNVPRSRATGLRTLQRHNSYVHLYTCCARLSVAKPVGPTTLNQISTKQPVALRVSAHFTLSRGPGEPQARRANQCSCRPWSTRSPSDTRMVTTWLDRHSESYGLATWKCRSTQSVLVDSDNLRRQRLRRLTRPPVRSQKTRKNAQG